MIFDSFLLLQGRNLNIDHNNQAAKPPGDVMYHGVVQPLEALWPSAEKRTHPTFNKMGGKAWFNPEKRI